MNSYDRLIDAYMQVITEAKAVGPEDEKKIADFEKQAKADGGHFGMIDVIALAMKDGSVKLLGRKSSKKLGFEVASKRGGMMLKGMLVDLSKSYSEVIGQKDPTFIPLSEVDHVVDPKAEPRRVSTAEELDAEFKAPAGEMLVIKVSYQDTVSGVGADGDRVDVVEDLVILPVGGGMYCKLYAGLLSPQWKDRGMQLNWLKQHIVDGATEGKSKREWYAEADKNRQARDAAREAEIVKLAETMSEEEVCHDWGTNPQSKRSAAAAYKHEQMRKADPSAHQMDRHQVGRAITEYACTCGYAYTNDASD